MRKLLMVIAGAGLLLALAAPVVTGDSDREYGASLNGYLEVPSISTTARGTFRAEIKGSTIHYRLTFRDLSSATVASHIHFARPNVNGGVVAFLCGGGGKPACPTSGTVRGTIVAVGRHRSDRTGHRGRRVRRARFGRCATAPPTSTSIPATSRVERSGAISDANDGSDLRDGRAMRASPGRTMSEGSPGATLTPSFHGRSCEAGVPVP